MDLYRNRRTGTYHWVIDGVLVCKTAFDVADEKRWQYVGPASRADSNKPLMCNECEFRLKHTRRLYAKEG